MFEDSDPNITILYIVSEKMLGIDYVQYFIDICTFQKTKKVGPGNSTLSNGYKLINMV